MSIGNARKYSDYAGPIDTLIAIGGDGAVAPQSPQLSKWLRERAAYTRGPKQRKLERRQSNIEHVHLALQ
jgi:hypothetical protein